jgi:NAD(P)-dependent dehydrogenase (short-subunit alcohol dehydrogenase family)
MMQSWITMNSQFKDKVVAITGAGKGLGRAYALHFAKLGANVVVNNRVHAGESESSADRVVAEITDAGGKAVAEYSDVENPQAGEILLATALENFGSLDCLVANAGIVENRTFRKLDLAQFRHVVEINLMGTVNVVHPAFCYMCEQQGGSIVVSTSSAGLFGQLGLPAYSASKAAVIGLMQSLSLEGKSKNVCVNAIAPYAMTNMTAGHLPESISARLDPALVAPVIAHLASGSVSGQVLIAGGGRASKAGPRTTQTLPGAGAGSAAWQLLDSMLLDQGFKDAGKNFAAFLADMNHDS